MKPGNVRSLNFVSKIRKGAIIIKITIFFIVRLKKEQVNSAQDKYIITTSTLTLLL